MSDKEAARLVAQRGFQLVGAATPPPDKDGDDDEPSGESGADEDAAKTAGAGGNQPPAGPGPLPSPSTLQAMRLAELQALAAERGVEVPGDATKRQIIEALAAAAGEGNAGE